MPVQLPLDALRLRQLNIAAGGGGGGGGQFFMCGEMVVVLLLYFPNIPSYQSSY